jgi:hypothetical protein
MTDKPRTATAFDFLEDADEELRAIAKQHARETATRAAAQDAPRSVQIWRPRRAGNSAGGGVT